MALIGIAGVPIGVDTERLPSRETVEDCSQELHPAERSELAAAGVEEQNVRFGQIWTRKEAFLKGIGTGLSRSLSEDYLGADVERHPRGWFLIDVTCGPTHCAAAAIRGPAPNQVNLRGMPGQWLGAPGTEADTNAVVPFTPVLAC
jgi:4'-phosphopantetheinyl transferase